MASQTRGVSSITLPGEPASASAARRFLTGVSGECGLPADLRETAVLLLSEVVTNSVLHAGTPIDVRCTVDRDGVLVEVRDRSPRVPLPRGHADEAVTGRGLELVELLASEYGVVSEPAGKTVWFAVGVAACDLPGGWCVEGEDDAVEVLLLAVPASLYDVLQQHNEALLREYELLRLAEGAGPAERQALADASRARVRLATAIRRAGAGRRVGGVDVAYRIPAPEAPVFQALPRVLDEAEAAAVHGRLLTRPALPELLELRGWLYGEIAGQLVGEGPRPWTAVTSHLSEPALPTVEVDLSWVAGSPDPLVVADDANRILAVSPPAAALLGWDAQELVGQRITAIVPPRLREAHVAGFTRQQVSGRGRLLGRTVPVAALHHDGHEVAVGLHLRYTPVADRGVYSAWLLPVPG